MNFRPCLLIPNYNHKDTIYATTAALAAYGLPIYLVDDGSDEATQTVLATVVREFPLVRLQRLPVNRGKGAAVMHGMRLALSDGMTHALQIDADGQHDAADVPRFLTQGEAHPEAVVCGRPVYDDSVPKARLYGRFVTHFWVWVETLSFAIKDSMCGFRLYPLAQSCALIDAVAIPARMEFDIEIMVRLAWRGLPIVNIPTRVTYPEGGLSHFDVVRDNLRISRMHTRLFFGMLARLPLLLWRRIDAKRITGRHWSRLGERGSSIGIRLLFAIYRLFGERTVRILLYPVAGYFFLTGGAARAASRTYLARLAAFRGDPAHPTWGDSFRHMLAFAESGLDKVSAWTGALHSDRIDFPNRGDFDQLLAAGKGAVIIGSHLGNLEMTRALAEEYGHGAVNAIVYTHHARRFTSLLEQVSNRYRVNLIQVSSLGPDTAIRLQEKVERGELLVIVGDRTPAQGKGRVTTAQFLGHPAPFAQGPFILASLLGCPVYLFFCLRETNGYRIYFEHFADRIELPRAQRDVLLRNYAQRYARRLETHCLKAPYQWFNFFDFWHSKTKVKA